MKIEILLNLGNEWGPEHWQAGEVREVPDVLAQKLIAKTLAAETDKPLSKIVTKKQADAEANKDVQPKVIVKPEPPVEPKPVKPSPVHPVHHVPKKDDDK